MTALLLAALALPVAGPAPVDPPADGNENEEVKAVKEDAANGAAAADPNKLSYALGVNVGRSLLADGLDPDPERFLAGLRDALTGGELALSEEELAAQLAAAAERVRDAQQQVRDARRAADRRRAAASREALAAFARQRNVTARSTGEAVRTDAAGTGPKPPAKGRVRLHYTARLAGEEDAFFTTRGSTDGSGPDSGTPIEIAVEELLPGLRTVLPGVPAGSTVTIGLPPDRAYGPGGGPRVPPDAALLVTVELLDVLPAPATAADRLAPPTDPPTPAASTAPEGTP